MKVRQLGLNGPMVTEICLGTMTWGTQNTESEAHAQMAYALSQGVTFWDTAELYPVNPPTAETYTLTEQYIGRFFAANPGTRNRVVLASKVAGPGRPYIRGGEGFTPHSIRTALEGSLTRLQTEYLDLYQLHWPNRGSYHFGQNWSYAPSTQSTETIEADMLATLQTLAALVQEGKIRHYGLSNETAWGIGTWVKLAKQHNLPLPVSTQNEYSLMYRLYDLDLLETCVREGISLLPYSPLAAGWLTGKYHDGARPTGSRFSLPSYATSQRLTPQAQKAADAYVNVANTHNLNPAQMALAFTLTRPGVASTIIGATTLDQLKTNIASATLTLSPAVMADLDAIRRLYPMPY